MSRPPKLAVVAGFARWRAVVAPQGVHAEGAVRAVLDPDLPILPALKLFEFSPRVPSEIN